MKNIFVDRNNQDIVQYTDMFTRNRQPGYGDIFKVFLTIDGLYFERDRAKTKVSSLSFQFKRLHHDFCYGYLGKLGY